MGRTPAEWRKRFGKELALIQFADGCKARRAEGAPTPGATPETLVDECIEMAEAIIETHLQELDALAILAAAAFDVSPRAVVVDAEWSEQAADAEVDAIAEDIRRKLYGSEGEGEARA